MTRLRERRAGLTGEQRRHWDERGYLVLPSFYDERTMQAVNEAVDRAWATRREPGNPLVADVLDGPRPRRARFADVDDDERSYVYKLNDLYLEDPVVRDVAISKRLAAVLGALLGSEIAVCNSLNFERGSQQPYHIDTFYMGGPQQRPDTLIVTSICLEDHHADAGPLTYFPGSHRIPPYRFSTGRIAAVPDEMDGATAYLEREIAERSLQAEDFVGRVGDVFVWHEQLYHGGRPIRDLTRTRRSLVTHYWSTEDLALPPGWSAQRHGRAGAWLRRAHQPVPA